MVLLFPLGSIKDTFVHLHRGENRMPRHFLLRWIPKSQRRHPIFVFFLSTETILKKRLPPHFLRITSVGRNNSYQYGAEPTRFRVLGSVESRPHKQLQSKIKDSLAAQKSFQTCLSAFVMHENV